MMVTSWYVGCLAQAISSENGIWARAESAMMDADANDFFLLGYFAWLIFVLVMSAEI